MQFKAHVEDSYWTTVTVVVSAGPILAERRHDLFSCWYILPMQDRRVLHCIHGVEHMVNEPDLQAVNGGPNPKTVFGRLSGGIGNVPRSRGISAEDDAPDLFEMLGFSANDVLSSQQPSILF